jgi:hypothetical protein
LPGECCRPAVFHQGAGPDPAVDIVAGWSAAEAAIFFLVADIPISWITVRSGVKAGLLAALVAAIASVVGILAVLVWAGRDPAGATAAMTALPGIDSMLVAKGGEIYHKGPLAALIASFSGTPFKLIALEAGKQGGYGLLLFAPFLRIPRFVAVALFVGIICRLLDKWMSIRQRLMLLGALWVGFYAFYFAVMPG